MNKKLIWLGSAALVAPFAWFVLASYAFVFLVGLHQWATGDADITSFHDRIVASGFYPWIAYWTYWDAISDPVDQQMHFGATFVPLVALAVIVGMSIVLRRNNRTRQKLGRWPWQPEDSMRP